MKDQTLSIFSRFKLGLVALALVVLALVGTSRIGSAQMGSGSPPPTYDWNDMAPGIQGPTSPLLAGAERRQLRLFRIQIPILVPLVELQAALPPGFIAIANPAGSNTGQVTLDFNFQQRFTRIADGLTVGGSGLGLQVRVLNTNVMPNREEMDSLGEELSTQESVDYFNALYGPGIARLAKVSMQFVEDGGIFSFKGNVTDDGLGLNVSAQATSPGPLVNRIKNDPTGGTNRYLISGISFRVANQRDELAVPRAMANANIDAPNGKLQVPVAAGGSRSLTISGIGATINFQRNVELFAKNE